MAREGWLLDAGFRLIQAMSPNRNGISILAVAAMLVLTSVSIHEYSG
jgi:hypothetical protein